MTTRRRGISSTQLYKNVPVLDSGARGSTITFAQRGIGDVLLAWENEAHLALKEFGADKFEIVTPPLSILAEPPVAVVDKMANATRHHRRGAGLSRISVFRRRPGNRRPKNFYRPRNRRRSRPNTPASFTPLKLVTVDAGFRRLGEGAENPFRRRRHL